MIADVDSFGDRNILPQAATLPDPGPRGDMAEVPDLGSRRAIAAPSSTLADSVCEMRHACPFTCADAGWRIVQRIGQRRMADLVHQFDRGPRLGNARTFACQHRPIHAGVQVGKSFRTNQSPVRRASKTGRPFCRPPGPGKADPPPPPKETSEPLPVPVPACRRCAWGYANAPCSCPSGQRATAAGRRNEMPMFIATPPDFSSEPFHEV